MKNLAPTSTPLIDTLNALREEDIYAFVSPNERTSALDYYRNGHVLQFSWLNNGETLCAHIQGQREYQVRFNQDDEGLICYCNCPAFGRSSDTCKHTAAALLTFCHSLDPSRFNPSPFKEKVREKLAKQILGKSGKVRTKEKTTASTFTLHQGWNGEYTVNPEGQNGLQPSHTPKWFKTLYAAESKKRDDLLLDQVAKADKGISFLIDIDEVTTEIEGVSETPYAWATEIDIDEVMVYIHLYLNGPKGTRVNTFSPCGEELAFLPTQKQLASVSKPEILHAYHKLRKPGRSTEDESKLYTGGFKTEQTLQFVYASCSLEQRNLLSELACKPGTQLLIHGVPAELEQVDPTFSAHFESNAESGKHHLKIVGAVKGIDLGWHEELDILEALKNSYEYPNALGKSKARQQALQEGEEHIYFSTDAEHTKTLIHSLSQQEIFKRIGCQQDVQNYLVRIDRETQKKVRKICPHKEKRVPAWLHVHHTRLDVAQIKAFARRIFNGDTLDGEAGVMVIENRALSRGLPAFETFCKERHVDLLFNHAPLRTTRIDIAVEVEHTPDVDWFELHPRVTADGLRVDQEKWEQLIRGELLEHTDGSFLLIEEESTQALQKVQTLLKQNPSPKRRKKNSATKVQRLRIFDWLDLERAGIQVDLPTEDREILKSLREFQGLESTGKPAGLKACLRPYQQEGLDWLSFLYQHRFGGCLADDMGLGKTIQAIALLSALNEKKLSSTGNKDDLLPHLVVVPPSLLFNWHHEIDLFCPNLHVIEYAGPDRKLDAKGGDVLITTYEIVRRDIKLLAKQFFDVIIFDEAQQVKNQASRRSKAVQELQARFRLCLTGTPLENHIGEYFNIMELALPGLLEDARPFTKTIGMEDEKRYVQRTHPFILRRTKSEILKELPPKQEFDVYLDMTEHQKELYTRTVAEVREQVLEAYADRSAAQAGIVALSALTRLRQICVSPNLLDPNTYDMAPKIIHLRSKLLELAEEGHAALVFSQFTRALDLIEPTLNEAGIEFTRLDGKTPTAQRKNRVAAFQSEEGPPVFLISLKAGGIGLNLTRATYVFHVDPWWNPAVETQATDRAHRIGQHQKVMVHRLLMHHTIEEKLMELKKKKKEVFERVIEAREMRQGSTPLSREDFDFILS